MPRPSRESEILDAALACFAERGYDGTRVRHIAQRAGVSEAALYRHHPSKEAVAPPDTQVRRSAGDGRRLIAVQVAAAWPGAEVLARVPTK